MKVARERNKGRKGSVLGSVLVLVSMMSMAVGLMCTASHQRVWKSMRLANQTRALAIAEAGVHYTYSVLTTNFNMSTNNEAFQPTSFDGGTYDVTVTPVDADTASIHSVGTYRDVTQEVILDVRRDRTGGTSSAVPGGPAYGYTILADGTVTWTGCGQFVGKGTVQANDSFTQSGCGELNADCYSCVRIRLNGKSGFIDGDCYAPLVNGKTSKIRGTIYKQAVAAVPLPDIALEPYYQHALANGEVYTGTKQITSDCAPVGGIMWVEGDLHISSQADVTGCFIATGCIKISSSGRHEKVESYPAFVSRDSYIKITSQFDAHGLFYTKVGDIEFAGGGSITGTILCGGNFKKSGNSTVFNYEESCPIPPGGSSSPGDDVIRVTAWQK